MSSLFFCLWSCAWCYRGQQSSLSTILWRCALRLSDFDLVFLCVVLLSSACIHNIDVLKLKPCKLCWSLSCLAFCFSFCACIFSSLLFVVMRRIGKFMTAHSSEARTTQGLSSNALCVTSICKTLLLEAQLHVHGSLLGAIASHVMQ